MAAKKSSSKKAQKQAVKFAKQHKKAVAIFVCVVLIIIIAAVLFIYLFKPEIFDRALKEYNDYVSQLYNDSPDDDAENVSAKLPNEIQSGDLDSISTSEFSIHFLELGNKYAGDCTLIKCGNTEVLIDAGSRTNSATTISAYVDRYCTDGKLEYVIATHAHQDHIAGFVGKGSGDSKTGILYKYEIGTVIQFAGHNTNSGIYKSYVSAVTYAQTKGAAVYTALQCWNNADGAKRSYDLSEKQDGSLTLNVLYNYYYEHETDDENDYSVCVLLSHTAEGSTSHYLFTGDLEGKGEGYLVDKNELPEVELFKGGHHGSKTSSTDKLLAKIKPKNVAVCCCAGATEYTTNHDNTFPTQAFVDRISKYTANVYLTSLCVDYKGGKFESFNGDIVFYMNDKKLSLWCSNNATLLKDTEWFKNNRTAAAWK
ncbi:MAG: MBL fold metallo-hydrolase [Clostridia bacterium]|nr:MBL fold metallo-hydrolase [Clostridia bacterium]